MRRLLISMITGYQRWISPLKKPCCRFYPTCSQYAILAIEKYGVFRGTLKALWRILRCNPFCEGGVDYP